MAGVVQRLIRHIFGTLANPANIENKQMKIDVGDNGAGTPRDRSRLITQDANSNQHVWVTLDEIEDYVTNEIASSVWSTSSSVYVLVTSPSEYRDAIEHPSPMNIWCDDGNGRGLILSYDTNISQNIYTITASKNIYGAGGVSIIQHVDFDITPSPIHIDRYFYPENTDNEIYVQFMDKILWTENGVGSGAYTITASGSVVGADHKFRTATIEGVDGVFGNITSSSPNTTLAECERNLLTSAPTGFNFVNWSGKNDRIWSNKESCETIASINKILNSKDQDANHTEIEYEADGSSTSTPNAYKRHSYNDEKYLEEKTYISLVDDNLNYKSAIKTDLLDSSGNMRQSSILTGDGHLAVSDHGLDPWDPAYNVIVDRGIALFSNKLGNGTNGIATECYIDSGIWRFSSISNVARLTLTNYLGEKSTFISTNTPSIDSAIDWKEIDRITFLSTNYNTSISNTLGEKYYVNIDRIGYYEIQLSVNVSFNGSSIDEGVLFHIQHGSSTIIAYPTLSFNNQSLRSVTLSVSFKKYLNSDSYITLNLIQANGVSLTEVNFSVESMKRD